MSERFDQINTPSDVRELLLFSKMENSETVLLQKRIEVGFEVKRIKQNVKRKVYRLTCPDHSVMYLKLFARQPFPFNIIRFYASKEFAAAKKLESLGLPVIHYLAWGHLQYGGFTLSEGVPGAVPMRQYFFETLIYDPEKLNSFLNKLSELIFSMRSKKIYHPDFHLGNILYSQTEDKLYLPDPFGVHQKYFMTRSDRFRLYHPWLEMRGSITEEQLINGIAASGLVSGKYEAVEFIEDAHKRWSRIQSGQYAKLTKRILSGTTKYSTMLELKEGKCFFRHTLWYAPPEKMELDPAWFKQKFRNHADSENIWVSSFLRTPPQKNPPLARLLLNDGSSILFYKQEPEV